MYTDIENSTPLYNTSAYAHRADDITHAVTLQAMHIFMLENTFIAAVLHEIVATR